MCFPAPLARGDCALLKRNHLPNRPGGNGVHSSRGRATSGAIRRFRKIRFRLSFADLNLPGTVATYGQMAGLGELAWLAFCNSRNVMCFRPTPVPRRADCTGSAMGDGAPAGGTWGSLAQARRGGRNSRLSHRCSRSSCIWRRRGTCQPILKVSTVRRRV